MDGIIWLLFVICNDDVIMNIGIIYDWLVYLIYVLRFIFWIFLIYFGILWFIDVCL